MLWQLQNAPTISILLDLMKMAAAKKGISVPMQEKWARAGEARYTFLKTTPPQFEPISVAEVFDLDGKNADQVERPAARDRRAETVNARACRPRKRFPRLRGRRTTRQLRRHRWYHRPDPQVFPILPQRRTSMSKIEISKATEILKKNQVDPAILSAESSKRMNLAVQPGRPGDGEEGAPGRQKAVRHHSWREQGRRGRLPKVDFVGWVLQIPETEEARRPRRTGFSRRPTSTTPRRRANFIPAKSVGEAIENVPVKFFKGADLTIKTRVPVLVLGGPTTRFRRNDLYFGKF